MEYDPAHKTSSITSIISNTSNSSNSTWGELPTQSSSNCFFEEYPEFNESLISERISIPPFDFIEDELTLQKKIVVDNNYYYNLIEDNNKELDFLNENNSTNQEDSFEPIYLQQGHELNLNKHQKLPSLGLNKKSKIIQKENHSIDEKRANHIVSEQKRRNTIRLGFKDLTDLIPTLKNINNSKSTILFKAVEYMKYLDKRNRSLKDKVASLKIKLQLQGKDISKKSIKKHQQLPNDITSTLLAHRQQQQQLEQLQHQLRVQHQLLTQHNIIPHDYQYNIQQNQKVYHSIFIPSCRSSVSDENDTTTT